MFKKLGKCVLAGILSACTVMSAAPSLSSVVRAADVAVVIDVTLFVQKHSDDCVAGDDIGCTCC